MLSRNNVSPVKSVFDSSCRSDTQPGVCPGVAITRNTVLPKRTSGFVARSISISSGNAPNSIPNIAPLARPFLRSGRSADEAANFTP